MLPKLFVWCSCLGLAVSVYVCPTQPIILTSALTSHPLESVPSNSNCNFTFIFNDSNSFALANISAYDIGENELVQVIGAFDTFNNNGDSALSFQGAFPPNQFVINVQTSSNTKMVLSYGLKKSPVEFNYQKQEDQFLKVGTRGSTETGFLRIDVSTDTTEIGASWTITAESTVSIIASCIPSTDIYTFLNIFVYEGSNSTDLKVLGSLYSMYNNLFNTERKTVTLYYATFGGYKFEGAVLLNDKKNLEDCHSYRTQWSHGNPSERVVAPGGEVFEIDTTVDASNGTSCLTILNEYTSDTKNRGNWPIFEKMIQTADADGTLQSNHIVIAGAPMNNITGLVLGTMGYQSSSCGFPQFFDGFMRTIMVDKGKIQLQTTTTYSKASPYNVTFGMKGFLMTDNYPFLADRQITSDALVLQHKRMFTFNFQVVHTDVKNGSSEQIVIESQGPANYGEIYLAGAAGKTYSINTTYVTLDIWVGTNYTENRGTFINYWVTKPGEPIMTTTATPIVSTTYTTRKMTTQTWSTQTTATVTSTPKDTTSTEATSHKTTKLSRSESSTLSFTETPTSPSGTTKEKTPSATTSERSTIESTRSVFTTGEANFQSSSVKTTGDVVFTSAATTLETTTKESNQTLVLFAIMVAAANYVL